MTAPRARWCSATVAGPAGPQRREDDARTRQPGETAIVAPAQVPLRATALQEWSLPACAAAARRARRLPRSRAQLRLAARCHQRAAQLALETQYPASADMESSRLLPRPPGPPRTTSLAPAPPLTGRRPPA